MDSVLLPVYSGLQCLLALALLAVSVNLASLVLGWTARRLGLNRPPRSRIFRSSLICAGAAAVVVITGRQNPPQWVLLLVALSAGGIASAYLENAFGVNLSMSLLLLVAGILAFVAFGALGLATVFYLVSSP
jgi:hypothetical protein